MRETLFCAALESVFIFLLLIFLRFPFVVCTIIRNAFHEKVLFNCDNEMNTFPSYTQYDELECVLAVAVFDVF